MKKISIIVPIYNIENYIKQCVESILEQNDSNFELLLIDDGSTDNSYKIIKEYESNNNVKIYKKENGGLSDARNFGILKSTGEYLMFIDGDDFLIDKNCIRKIRKEIDDFDYDVIQYKMVYYYGSKNKFIYNKNLPKLVGKGCDEVIKTLYSLNEIGMISVSACDKIIKRDIIVNNNLFFKKGLLNEDVLWSYSIYKEIKSISITNYDIYGYRQQRIGSISTEKSKKLANDLLYVIDYWYNYNYESDIWKNLYFNMIAYWYLILRTKFSRNNFSIDDNNKIKNMGNILLKYNCNFKVNIASKLKKIIGLNNTIKIMKIYLVLKNKGVIKL